MGYSSVCSILFFNSYKWALSNPPKPHAFVSLPSERCFGLILFSFLSNPKVIVYRFIIMFILGTLFKYTWCTWNNMPYTYVDVYYTSYMSFLGALLSDMFTLLPSPLALYNFFVHGKSIFTDIKLPMYMAMDQGGPSNPSPDTSDKIGKIYPEV